MRYGPGRRQTTADTHRRALFSIGTGAPVDLHLARHQRAVFFYTAFAVDDRFVPVKGGDKGFLAIELHPYRAAVGVKREGYGDGFHLETAFRTKAAALKGVDEANFFFGHVQRFGDFMKCAERRVVGDPDGQPAALLVELRVRRMGFHGGMLDHRHEISFLQDKI